jgi:cytochrome P450
VAQAELKTPGTSASAARDLPSASLVEGVRFTLLAALPNVIQGLFRRRPRVVRVANWLDLDRRAVRTVDAIRRRHGPGPVWVRVLTKPALLVLSTDDIRRVLGGSPDPFAADPEPKRRGMSHFQPDALTLSRDGLWENRRRFTEAVLDTGEPVHHLADRFLGATKKEAQALLSESGAQLDWDAFHRASRRITRRIVLGDAARDDEAVSDLLAVLMDEANKLPKERSEHFEAFMAKLEEYVSAGEEGSLVSLFGEAPSDGDTKVAGQLPHWLFALGDTLPINAFRALALIASHPAQRARVEQELESADLDAASGVAGLDYLEACLEEAMRLWPTTPLLSRETVQETEVGGAAVPAGAQVLISNTFNHRDGDSHDFADRFSPESWTKGSAADDWSFNHFSHGPQGCPGTGIALFVGRALLAELLTQSHVSLAEPKLDPGRPLPHMLDFFRLRFALEPLRARGRDR